MLMNTDNSYQMHHVKKKSYEKLCNDIKALKGIKPDRLLVDRAAYVAYLEAQLERVTAVALTRNSFDEHIAADLQRISQVEQQVESLKEQLKDCSADHLRLALTALTARVASLEAARTERQMYQCNTSTAMIRERSNQRCEHKHVSKGKESRSERAAKQLEELKERQDDLQEVVGKLVLLAEQLDDPDRHLVRSALNAVRHTVDAKLGMGAAELRAHCTSPAKRQAGGRCAVATAEKPSSSESEEHGPRCANLTHFPRKRSDGKVDSAWRRSSDSSDLCMVRPLAAGAGHMACMHAHQLSAADRGALGVTQPHMGPCGRPVPQCLQKEASPECPFPTTRDGRRRGLCEEQAAQYTSGCRRPCPCKIVPSNLLQPSMAGSGPLACTSYLEEAVEHQAAYQDGHATRNGFPLPQPHQLSMGSHCGVGSESINRQQEAQQVIRSSNTDQEESYIFNQGKDEVSRGHKPRKEMSHRRRLKNLYAELLALDQDNYSNPAFNH
eukprot:jgi/Botrbrau1/5053/Bobra.37_1s0018.1